MESLELQHPLLRLSPIQSLATLIIQFVPLQATYNSYLMTGIAHRRQGLASVPAQMNGSEDMCVHKKPHRVNVAAGQGSCFGLFISS